MNQLNTSKRAGWQPCFDLSESQPFETLLHRTNQAIISKLNSRESLTPGIMAGDSGSILALFYSALYLEDESLFDKAHEFLERLVGTIDPSENQLSLCSGLAGLVWLLLHLDKEGILTVGEDMISEEVLDYLCETSIAQINGGAYDYMHQGLGTTLALLSSKNPLCYADYFTEVVAGLAASAREYKNGLYWKYSLTHEEAPDISLGLSHGLPAVMSILSKIASLDINTDLCHHLIEKVATLLLTCRNNLSLPSLYPSTISLEKTDQAARSRLGWCYGDPGIAAAFIHAGRSTSRQQYLDEADRIIAFTGLRRDGPDAGVEDGGFCHGSLGVAHIFNRFYQYKRDPALREQARYWFNRSLDMIQPGTDLIQPDSDHLDIIQPGAGNLDLIQPGTAPLAVSRVLEKRLIWNEEPEILQGIGGISLTLLSAISPRVPSWDEIFLFDIQ